MRFFPITLINIEKWLQEYNKCKYKAETQMRIKILSQKNPESLFKLFSLHYNLHIAIEHLKVLVVLLQIYQKNQHVI